MFAFGKLPQYVYAMLEKQGIDEKDLLIGLYCDMDKSHSYNDSFVFASADELIVLSVKKEFGIKTGIVRGVNESYELINLDSYPISDIERLKTEELLSSARLTAKTKDGQSLLLCAMTNFCRSNASTFVKYFDKIQKGEIASPDFEVEPPDRPDAVCCEKCGTRYPDHNRKICPKCMEKGKLYTRFATFLLKYKKELLLMFLSLVMLTATGILIPYFSKGFFFDNVLEPSGKLYGQVLTAVAIVVATQLLSQFADMVNGYVSTKISAKIVYDLKNTIFTAIEKLSMSFFTGRQTGNLMTQVNDDSNTIYGFFCDGMPYFLTNIIQVIILAVLLFVMNPLLALMSLVTVPVFFLLLRRTYRASKKLHARKYSGARRMNSQLSDVLGGIRVVKAFSKEETEMERFLIGNKRAAKGSRALSVFNNYAYPSASLVLYVGNMIALGVGGYMVMRGSFTYGELITFTAYVNMIYSPMNFFSQMINWSASCTNALSRLYEIYDTEPEISEKQDPISPDRIEGRVEFKSVSFGYSENRKVIEDVSFDIEAGKTLGIVGHTGAGKSTIANLIMRLYDVQDGSVLIDGINVKDLSFRSLYDNIAIVSQETYLFIGSILDNIRYAKPDATNEEVIRAAKCAGAHDFIIKLPDGYNTRIGFGNQDLSGGERQRVSIARAILRDPKILILDEATAAMDTRTEKLIQNALTELTRGKTTIVIAHRLSTLRDAHKLIVIEKGKVAEQGTHRELLSVKDGVYNKLYTLQQQALKNAGITE